MKKLRIDAGRDTPAVLSFVAKALQTRGIGLALASDGSTHVDAPHNTIIEATSEAVARYVASQRRPLNLTFEGRRVSVPFPTTARDVALSLGALPGDITIDEDED